MLFNNYMFNTLCVRQSPLASYIGMCGKLTGTFACDEIYQVLTHFSVLQATRSWVKDWEWGEQYMQIQQKAVVVKQLGKYFDDPKHLLEATGVSAARRLDYCAYSGSSSCMRFIQY